MMNTQKFQFYKQPKYWTLISVPLLIVFFSFLVLILFYLLGIYLKILLTLVLFKILHHIYTKGVKKIIFNCDAIHVVHYNGKTTMIDYSEVNCIEARKFSLYQTYYTNVVRYKKNSKIKQVIHFYCPVELLSDFTNFLNEKLIIYKKIGYRL
jgi:predicted membrane protein